LARYVSHRLAREAKVRRALEAAQAAGATPATASALVPAAYADAPRAVWPLATLAVEAHLLKLEHEGAAVREGSRWHAGPDTGT
ncbi:MAG: MBL fold metallo-hydrolase, partial [Myxococcota bacterium]